jgi:hypothetical protein
VCSGHIVLVASTQLPQAPGSPSTFCLKIPKLKGYFTGTGVAQQHGRHSTLTVGTAAWQTLRRNC